MFVVMPYHVILPRILLVALWAGNHLLSPTLMGFNVAVQVCVSAESPLASCDVTREPLVVTPLVMPASTLARISSRRRV